nr:hypothetical protein [uncultured Bacteroides sp.]
MDKSHNEMALIMITGMIFSIAGFVLANVSGLKLEKIKMTGKRKNTTAIINNRTKK